MNIALHSVLARLAELGSLLRRIIGAPEQSHALGEADVVGRGQDWVQVAMPDFVQVNLLDL